MSQNEIKENGIELFDTIRARIDKFFPLLQHSMYILHLGSGPIEKVILMCYCPKREELIWIVSVM